MTTTKEKFEDAGAKRQILDGEYDRKKIDEDVDYLDEPYRSQFAEVIERAGEYATGMMVK